MKEFFIENRKIGENSPIFLIAEVGVNHNGKLSIAKKLIDIASKAKVDAIKFQTFKAEKLMLETTLKADYQKTNLNDNENFYEMIKKYEKKLHKCLISLVFIVKWTCHFLFG